MKQTNNAIKFLMAQYRAIFNNAYLKGIASAVLLTAGLAVAGNAQAVAVNVTSTQLAGTEDITVDGTTTTKLGGDLDDLGSSWNAPVKVTGGANTDNALTQTNDVSISGSGSLTIETTSATDGVKITATDGKSIDISINALTINKGTLLIEGGNTEGKNATFSANTISLGKTDPSATVGDAKVTLNKSTGAASSVILGSDTSTIKLAKTAEVVFAAADASDAVLAGSLQATGGKLNFSGAGTLKVYTADNAGATVDVEVTGEKNAVLDLSEATGKTLKLAGGTFNLKSNGTTGAKFTVKNGTLEIADAVELTSSESAASGGVIELKAKDADDNDISAENAVLKISSAKLQNFLGDKQSDGTTPDVAGHISLTQGTLELTNETDVSKLNIEANGSTTNGAISVGDSADKSVIKGTTLSITTDGLKDVEHLTVQANTLKMTELAGQDEKNQLFKGKTIAANYDVTLNKTAAADGTAADNAYTVSHEMGWLSTTEVTNPYHVANNKPADPEKITVAANGTIGHDYIVTSGDTGYQGNFHIIGGHYTDANDIELKNGGKLTVGGATAGQKGAGIDASLTLTSAGSLTLNNSGSSATNEIEIAGNASGDKWHDDSVDANDVQFVPESVLDLSQGTIQFAYDDHDAPAAGKTYQVKTNITVGEGGELIVRDDQMNYLLNNLRTLEQRNAAVSGAAINLSGGTVTVKGDLELDISKISTNADTGDTINFENGGYLVADNIVLEEKEEKETETTGTYTDSGTPLNLGAEGHLVAETITLNNRNINSNNTGFVDYQVTAGTLQVGSALSSVNSTVVFGDGSTGGASLTLGYIDPNYDEYRIRKDGTYNLSAETGTVQPNLKLNGAASDPNKTALTVNYGAWTLKNNLEASNATITVGSNGYERDANGDLYTASLTGQGLTLHNGTNMTVNSNAEVTFDTFKMDGSTAQVHVNNTTMTINGKHTEATSTVEESWGLEVTGGTVTVDGRNGVLAIGAEALSSVKATKADGKFTLANDLPVSGFVTLKNWATLSLELDSADVFGEESLVALRKAFLSNTYSVNGAPVDEGYIDIGKARIDGINVINNQVSWNEMQKYKDIIADIVSADTSKATLINVTSATDVQANVGNVKADGNTQVVNFNDTSLRAGTNGFVKNENGENIDANVNAGSRLGLYSGGSIENVTLEAGNENIGTTKLSVVSSAAEGATEPETTIASVDGKGDQYTAFVVQGKTTVNGKVDVGELFVDKALTIKGEAYAENGLYSSETTDPEGNVSLVREHLRGARRC